VASLADALDTSLITTHEALAAHDGFIEPEPTLSEMATLLLPRGVAPEVIADLFHL